jgi:hypothetical protein
VDDSVEILMNHFPAHKRRKSSLAHMGLISRCVCLSENLSLYDVSRHESKLALTGRVRLSMPSVPSLPI